MKSYKECAPVPIKDEAFFSTVFQNSLIGQAIVTEDLNLVAANKQMFQYLQLVPCDISGTLFGCAFHCVNLHCGESPKCKNCYIRNAVQDIIVNHMAIRGSIIKYTFRSPKRKTKWFQLNGAVMENSGQPLAVLTFTDISEFKSQEKKLRKLLSLDLATGAMNKHYLMDSLQRLINSRVAGFTISMIDFDGFKEVNDRYGHLIGDKVLEAFAEIARKNIRKRDILGRYGGEEFIFAFLDTLPAQALSILERIHKELYEYFADDLDSPITFSAGLLYVDNNGTDYTQCCDLIGTVDRLLYVAKKKGRNMAVGSFGEVKFDT